MNRYLKSIDKQIEFNKGKNILLDDADLTFGFIEETVQAISDMSELSSDSEKMLIDYATDKALEEFCRINQYYTFNCQAKNDLRNIYCELFANIRTPKKTTESISKNHYRKIRQWLQQTNPFAEKIYAHAGPAVKAVACSEYSAQLQMSVLNIDTNSLMQPVLDIGCGKHGNLVNYLCDLEIETRGIDRFSFSEPNLMYSDWLEYNYGIEKWGTIVSNLGFSNHFTHHNLREDGNYIAYGKKYMDILKSLKMGGKFHYAPDLPFIEIYLNKTQFQIEKYDISKFDFKTTVITRLK